MFDIDKKNAVLKVCGIKLLNVEPAPLYNDAVSKKTELDSILFQMHPKWGFPVSDSELMNDSSVSQTIRNAIEQRNIPRSVSSNGIDDDDVVLDTMIRDCESPIEYYDRMKPYTDELENKK